MLSALRCPSDGTGHNMKLNKNQAQFIGTEVALTNYKGVIGDPNMGGGGYGSADTHGEDQNNGMFWRRSWKNPIHVRDVLDGTSNTFMIGEDVPKFNYHSAWFFSNGDYCSCHRPLNFFAKPPPPDDATGHHHWPRDMGFRSQHPGISQFALVDGSVRGVRQNIDRDQYRAFCTRAGGESIASE
jgi:hypothetical protein